MLTIVVLLLYHSECLYSLYVNCNAGRVLRPLIIIKDNKPLLTQDLLDKISKKLLSWNDLLRMGVLEMIDF